MIRTIESAKTSRFDNHILSYFFLYLLLLAPPRALNIKKFERKQEGELAQFPSHMVFSIELVFRIFIIITMAAAIEEIIGNEVYEAYSFDTFFVTLSISGIIHSITFYCVFGRSGKLEPSSSLILLYRFVRNSCYATLMGFVALMPFLLLSIDRGEALFSQGTVFVHIYSITALFFFVIGCIEAKLMTRVPLGGYV